MKSRAMGLALGCFVVVSCFFLNRAPDRLLAGENEPPSRQAIHVAHDLHQLHFGLELAQKGAIRVPGLVEMLTKRVPGIASAAKSAPKALEVAKKAGRVVTVLTVLNGIDEQYDAHLIKKSITTEFERELKSLEASLAALGKPIKLKNGDVVDGRKIVETYRQLADGILEWSPSDWKRGGDLVKSSLPLVSLFVGNETAEKEMAQAVLLASLVDEMRELQGLVTPHVPMAQKERNKSLLSQATCNVEIVCVHLGEGNQLRYEKGEGIGKNGAGPFTWKKRTIKFPLDLNADGDDPDVVRLRLLHARAFGKPFYRAVKAPGGERLSRVIPGCMPFAGSVDMESLAVLRSTVDERKWTPEVRGALAAQLECAKDGMELVPEISADDKGAPKQGDSVKLRPNRIHFGESWISLPGPNGEESYRVDPEVARRFRDFTPPASVQPKYDGPVMRPSHK